MTQAEGDPRLLLEDAAERVVANPEAAAGWCRLVACAERASRQLPAAALAALLVRHVPDTGLAGFHLQLHLGWLTGDWTHWGRAATLLQTLRPRDPERDRAFLHAAWQVALRGASDQQVFVQRLQAARLPAIAQALGQDLAQTLPRGNWPDAIAPLRRVALVAPALAGLGHPPTRMVLDQAWVLLRQGLQVQLFAAQENSWEEFDSLLGGSALRMREQPLDSSGWADHVGADLVLHQVDTRFSVGRRLRHMLPALHAWQPDVVLCVGLVCSLGHALAAVRPVLALATNSVPPMVANDVWLSATSDTGPPVPPWAMDAPASLAWYHPYRVRQRRARGQHSRQALGIPASATVMMTLSNGQYLARLDTAWLERVARLMQQRSGLVWVLAGCPETLPATLLDLQRAVPAAQLRTLPFSTDPAGLLQLGDLYLHPPQTGGGFAVADAMAEGLAVLALAGSDGGSKLGDEAAPDLATYFQRLQVWIDDPQARAAQAARMRQHFASQVDLDASGPSLVQALEVARTRFARRQAAG